MFVWLVKSAFLLLIWLLIAWAIRGRVQLAMNLKFIAVSILYRYAIHVLHPSHDFDRWWLQRDTLAELAPRPLSQYTRDLGHPIKVIQLTKLTAAKARFSYVDFALFAVFKVKQGGTLFLLNLAVVALYLIISNQTLLLRLAPTI